MADDIQAYVAHFHPLLGSLMQQVGLVDTVNHQIGDPDSRIIVDTGTVVSALIHNLLGNTPVRLYRMDHFFADKPLPLLFPWCPDLPLGALNDDRAGRALDELWVAGPQKVFSGVSRSMIAQYQLDTSVLHLDSTSKCFYGTYENQGDAHTPELTYGYSKDRRPDLVQLLFGLGTTRDGVVVFGDVASGNTQDMVANGSWITQVRDQLGRSANDFLLYVADSAVVTEENLKVMRLFHQDLISRLPARFALHDQLLIQAPANLEEWEELGALGHGKEAARYKAWETEAELAGSTYRFVALWSDSLAAQHRRTLDRKVAREWAELEKALAEIEQQTFEQEEDAQAYRTTFLARKKLRYHQVTSIVEPEEVELPYSRPGRPPKGATRPTAIRYRLRLTPICDLATFRQACQSHGKFVLITSLRDRQRRPARDILAEYKEQHTAERAFRFIKDPTWVGAFCLKKPERIVAFAYVLLMAAMLYTLLERQVRQRLQMPDEKPVLGLDNRPTKQPTAYAIKTILAPILIIAVLSNGQWSFRPSQPLNPNQRRVLSLAGFDEQVYHWRGELSNGLRAENGHAASP